MCSKFFFKKLFYTKLNKQNETIEYRIDNFMGILNSQKFKTTQIYIQTFGLTNILYQFVYYNIPI